MMRLPALLVPALVAVFALGCTVQYTNIPPIEGDRLARHDPNRGNVRAVTALALDELAANRDFAGPVRIILPEGSSEATYEAVAAAMEIEAVPGDVLSGEEAPTLEVRQVRLRGARAELDIIQGRPGDAAQLATVHLSRGTIAGWEVDRLRLWRLGSDWPRHPGPDPDEAFDLEAQEQE